MTGACARCLRRGWLLAELSPVIDYHAHDREALLGLLALGDEDLLRALAGRRRANLIDRYARFDARALSSAAGVETLCRHSARYPRTLDGALAPRALHVAGSAQRLADLVANPIVAIVGSARPTDYGIEMAKGLARGLAVSGVTVVSALAEGIGAAAAEGSLEVKATPLAVMSGGADVPPTASMRSLHERVVQRGCAVAEIPCGSPVRRWGQIASARVLASLAALTVVVEAEETPQALAGAHVARQLGRAVAAVPGRVTSQASRGTHALLIGGASLIRCPQDVLELLFRCAAVGQAPSRVRSGDAPVALEAGLRTTLDLVGAGCDTPERLIGAGDDADAVLTALSELELMGLLTRGDGGRYVPRDGRARDPRALPCERQMES